MSISEETLVSGAKAVAALPGRPHISTFWRWHRRGIAGVKLETIVIGGRRFTSKESLERFFAAVTAAKDGVVPERVPCRRRKKQIEQAEAELAAAGI